MENLLDFDLVMDDKDFWDLVRFISLFFCSNVKVSGFSSQMKQLLTVSFFRFVIKMSVDLELWGSSMIGEFVLMFSLILVFFVVLFVICGREKDFLIILLFYSFKFIDILVVDLGKLIVNNCFIYDGEFGILIFE